MPVILHFNSCHIRVFSFQFPSHLGCRGNFSLLSCCAGFRADLWVIRLDMILQVLNAFELNATLWTPQPGQGLVCLSVPGCHCSSTLAGTLAVRSPD